jgi:SAM-dependent methyltransferase/methyltransferase-like protein
MKPPPVTDCRVLELGCGTGANLVPMAVALPESRFLGIDLSPVQIAAGRRDIAELGLRNVSLEVGDIAQLSAELGTFDFVIAHGVFSWVSEAVQEGLLATVRACLAEEGVAYVSYSVLPGASARQALRETLLWRVKDESDPRRRVTQARRFAESLADKLTSGTPQSAAIRQLVAEMGAMSDAYVLHDYLSPTHRPVTLTEFVERARAHRLRYLADAQFHTLFPSERDAAVIGEMLEGRPSDIDREQLHDIHSGRTFRTTLLCRAERNPDRRPSWEHLNDSFLSTRAEPRGVENGSWLFRRPEAETFETTSALVAAALACLADSYPRPVAFPVLCDRACSSVDGRAASREDIEEIGSNLLAAYASDHIDVGTWNRGIAGSGDPSLQAFSFARLQAVRGNPVATNLWHQSVELGPVHRRLLALLDGRHLRGAFVDELFTAHPDMTEERVEEALTFLAKNALLWDHGG